MNTVIEQVAQTEWLSELKGLTLNNIRTKRDGDDPIPYVYLSFEGDFEYEIRVKKNTYFEGALVNSLRKVKTIDHIEMYEHNGYYIVEVCSRSFALFVLRAKLNDGNAEFPFELAVVQS